MSGKWEVAGKSKKAMGASKKAAKKAKKEMPKAANEESGESFAVTNPLMEHDNIFNLMSQSEKTHTSEGDVENKENYITKPRISAKSKPKKKPSPTATKKSDREMLLDQLEHFDLSELTHLISEVKKKFPKHPLVWLKDVQSYFQMKIKVRECDPGLLMYECGYPYNILSADLRDFLSTLYREIPDTAMTSFYIECLNHFARDVRTGAGTYHHRILLQSMSLHCPKTVQSKAVTSELKSLLDDSVSRTKECVALLWCLQMTPLNKLETKLKVWFTWMLPLLQGKKTEKPVQDFIVRCLEDIINECGDSKQQLEITPSDFFGYLDLVFTVNSNLYPHVQALMVDMLDSIKSLAFALTPESRLRSFFPSLLIRLHASETPQKGYVLQYLMECLQYDTQCWLLWQQMYAKHSSNSLILLEHIHDNWATVSKTLNKAPLRQTLDFLTMTLTPTSGKNTKLKESQRRSLELCTDMSHALASPVKAAFKLALVVMITLTTAYILHDVKEFGSFKASRTGRVCTTLLQHNAVKQSLALMQKYGNQVHEYGMKHSPVLMEYFYTICNSVASTLTLFALTIQTNFNYVIDNRAEITEQAKNMTIEAAGAAYGAVSSLARPENVQWLENVGSQYMEYGRHWAAQGPEYAALGAKIAEENFYVAQTWITDNFINDPVTVDRLKGWGLIAYEWLLQTYSDVYSKFYTTFVA